MIATIERRLEAPSGALVDSLLTEARDFSTKHQFGDDVCLVGVELDHLISRDTLAATRSGLADGFPDGMHVDAAAY